MFLPSDQRIIPDHPKLTCSELDISTVHVSGEMLVQLVHYIYFANGYQRQEKNPLLSLQLERLGLGGPREDSMWMLCLLLGYGSPMGGCGRNQNV